jgi:WD40 repeat protein
MSKAPHQPPSLPARQLNVLRGHSGYVLSAKFNRRLRTLLLASLKGGQLVIRSVMINTPSHFTFLFLLSPGDGNYCMTGAQDKTIKLWNPLRPHPIKTYTGHGYEVRDLAM